MVFSDKRKVLKTSDHLGKHIYPQAELELDSSFYKFDARKENQFIITSEINEIDLLTLEVQQALVFCIELDQTISCIFE